jgi:hypothetical protein
MLSSLSINTLLFPFGRIPKTVQLSIATLFCSIDLTACSWTTTISKASILGDAPVDSLAHELFAMHYLPPSDQCDSQLHYPLISSIATEAPDTLLLEFSMSARAYFEAFQQAFSDIDLFDIFSLNQKYSPLLYPVLLSAKPFNHISVSIEELKHTLGATNYERFADFTRYVLTPALFDIWNNTRLFASYRLVKCGRKFDSIEFIINRT